MRVHNPHLYPGTRRVWIPAWCDWVEASVAVAGYRWLDAQFAAWWHGRRLPVARARGVQPESWCRGALTWRIGAGLLGEVRLWRCDDGRWRVFDDRLGRYISATEIDRNWLLTLRDYPPDTDQIRWLDACPEEVPDARA